MSIVNLNYKFKTLQGETVQEKIAKLDKEENQIFNEFGAPQFELIGDFTLRKIIEDTLFTPPMIRDDRTGQVRQISDQKKKACYKLLNKIMNNKSGNIELESEDITLLKDLITKKYNAPWTIGQAREILDSAEGDEDPEKEGKKK